MVKSGFSSIDKSTQKTKEWLHDMQNELGWDDENEVYVSFKAVIQTLRDRLPIDEAIEFGDELPMVMKGIYYDGYSPRRKPEKIKNQTQFFEKVQEKSPRRDIKAEEATIGVFSILQRKLSGGGEIDKVKHSLPKDLQRLWEK